MYSGFITTKHVIAHIGVHQRFDVAAHHMIRPFVTPESFPDIKSILYFEGYNGPDGLKLKSPGVAEPSHLYNPNDDSGDVPLHIASHYGKLVNALGEQDMVRGAFEASWLAHYVADGLTPAHHFPLHEEIARAKSVASHIKASRKPIHIARGHWDIWGAKGHMSTHVNFEMGVAFALGIGRVKTNLDDGKLARARRLGVVEFFKEEAREVARLNIYDKFYAKGWTAEIAKVIKTKIAPQTAEAIGTIWLLAYLEAGEKMAKAQPAS